MSNRVRVVYRPKTEEERQRILRRTEQYRGTPFRQLPGKPPQHKVLFEASDGTKVRVKDVEMVYNDAMLADFVSNNGEDGPLYADTIEGLKSMSTR